MWRVGRQHRRRLQPPERQGLKYYTVDSNFERLRIRSTFTIRTNFFVEIYETSEAHFTQNFPRNISHIKTEIVRA